MRHLANVLATLILASLPLAAPAVQPYLTAEKVQGGDLPAAMATIESKLTTAGFAVIGRHLPRGIDAGTVIATDAELLAAIEAVGGTSIVAAPIRIGVLKDGTVSTINPEYWLRALTGDSYRHLAGAGAAVTARLHTALNTGAPFGGDVGADQLPRYRFMFGMERFGDRALIKDYGAFDTAIATVEANLAKGVASTAKVYEIVLSNKKVAVIGFAQNDPERGESWWVNRISGADHIAALPWEVFVVDGKVYGLYARYRTALAWPTLGMGQFMTIVHHPDATYRMIKAIADAN